MEDNIKRVRDLLTYIPHAVIATVSEDGAPHNTPVFGVFDDDLHFFWSSSPSSQHSRNITRDPRVFVVFFDSHRGNGGLYVNAKAEQLDDPADLDYSYELLSRGKARLNAPMAARETYGDNGSQRLYRATPQKLWVSQSTKDESGAIIFDQRFEIQPSDLRSAQEARQS